MPAVVPVRTVTTVKPAAFAEAMPRSESLNSDTELWLNSERAASKRSGDGLPAATMPVAAMASNKSATPSRPRMVSAQLLRDPVAMPMRIPRYPRPASNHLIPTGNCVGSEHMGDGNSVGRNRVFDITGEIESVDDVEVGEVDAASQYGAVVFGSKGEALLGKHPAHGSVVSGRMLPLTTIRDSQAASS